jgi:hypothetical protein
MQITEATVKLTDKGNGLIFRMRSDTDETDKVYLPFEDGTESGKGTTARSRAMDRLASLVDGLYDETTNPVEFAKALVGRAIALDDDGRFVATL